ncbi:MAG: DUF4115 domain-containing protein [Gammaproteobacteria bacterium]|nr:DUF4115 domain-containing protein [Gammaproteobacteria bacterium]MCP5135487.1 DUF4115 domain-containing protein [Gammaproteobacteria bacterium]
MELSSVGPGHRLRDARKLSNLDQSDIATQLNLDIATINALEKDDYARMPPAVFVRGYLRAYAGMVGLSVDDILSSFDAMQGIDPSERNYRAATRITATGAPKPRSNVVPVALVLVVLIAAIAGGAYWWWQQQSARTSSQVATESSAKPAVVEEPVIPMEMDSQQQVAPAEPVAMPEPVIGTAEAIREGMTALAEDSASAVPVESPVDANKPANKLPAPIMTDMPAHAVDGAPDTSSSDETMPARSDAVDQTTDSADTAIDHLTLSYSDNCWTQIRDAAGKRLAFGVMKAGQVLELSGVAPFDVTLGQSDGVTVQFNGKPFDHTRFSRGKIARFQISKDSATAE